MRDAKEFIATPYPDSKLGEENKVYKNWSILNFLIKMFIVKLLKKNKQYS